MNESNPNVSNQKALVTVFDKLETANQVLFRLNEEGFPWESLELVRHNVHAEAPQVDTPPDHETTASSLVGSATKWGSLGAGTGLVAAGLLASFPGMALGMIFVGGVTGALIGGVAGLEHAAEDDSVDLPTLEEYEKLVEEGDTLLVVLGNHEEAMRAEEIIQDMADARSHIHTLHGHEFHEHPARLPR